MIIQIDRRGRCSGRRRVRHCGRRRRIGHRRVKAATPGWRMASITDVQHRDAGAALHRHSLPVDTRAASHDGARSGENRRHGERITTASSPTTTSSLFVVVPFVTAAFVTFVSATVAFVTVMLTTIVTLWSVTVVSVTALLPRRLRVGRMCVRRSRTGTVAEKVTCVQGMIGLIGVHA